MKTTLLVTALFSLATVLASGQVVVNQWNFMDTSGTDLGAAADSIGSATFSDSLGGGGTWATDGSVPGLLSGLGRIGNADIADVSSGVYQFDLTGVTFAAMTGGTDDSAFFALRNFSSGNNTGFNGANSSGSNQAVIVFGNENDSGGLDVEVIDNNSSVFTASDVTSDFTGTFDFRIVLDFGGDTADYLWQRNGGGYTSIGTQQFNGVGSISHLALGSNGFGATVSIDEATFSQVPEPSTYALLSGVLVLGLVMVRRRMG